jgi:hypothetical protein
VKGAIPQRAATAVMEASLDLVVMAVAAMEVDNPTRYLGGCQVINSQILTLAHDSNKWKACFWDQVNH